MPLVALLREGGNACYWCGTQGWIERCGRCGFFTCDACRKPHNADSFKFGEPVFTGVWNGLTRPSRAWWPPQAVGASTPTGQQGA